MPRDAVQSMVLAQRYVGLHAAALLTLACRHSRNPGTASVCSPAVLLVYLAAQGLTGDLQLPDSLYGEVLEQGATLVDQRRLVSAQPMPLAG